MATDAQTARPLPRDHEETTALLGMTLFVASWAMLFAALFFAYGLVRVRSNAWPPADLPGLPLALPALGTVVLALASFALERARRLVRDGRPTGLAPLVTALAASAVFLGVQVLVWQSLWSQGLRLDSGPYGSVVFGMTGFHALHVLVGLGGLSGLLLASSRAGAVRPLPLRLWTLYLHMVGILWGLMFIAVYLV
jgi:cytochrome c oxidase subunit III